MATQRCVLTLGTFDGVHRGHQRILREVVRRAKRLQARSVVLAFGMPPRHTGETVVRPVLLSTLPEKQRLFKALGIDYVHVLVFDRATASTPPDRFFQDTMIRRFRAREIVVGPRLAFGKNRAGRLPLLRSLGKRSGVRIHAVPPAKVGRVMVSSRRIRQLLAQGRVETAQRLLGYYYSVTGQVIAGAHRGRRLGFPTANLQIDRRKIVPPGVFWVKVLMPGHRKAIDGLCNVGTRPTFTPASHTMHCEVFLLQKTKNLYGRTLRVLFLRRIRGEKRFSSASELQNQIRRDLQKARHWIQHISLQNQSVSL